MAAWVACSRSSSSLTLLPQLVGTRILRGRSQCRGGAEANDNGAKAMINMVRATSIDGTQNSGSVNSGSSSSVDRRVELVDAQVSTVHYYTEIFQRQKSSVRWLF